MKMKTAYTDIVVFTHRNSLRPFGRLALLFLLGPVLVLSLLSGCVRKPNDRTPDGRIIVDYWEKWTGFEQDAMQAVVDDFNASQTNIVVRMLAVSGIENKLMLSAAGGNPPDVAGLWSHSLVGFSDKNALLPLDGYAREAGVTREDYIPAFWDLCSYRGFLWGLPSTPATLALHWNKKMFREAGLNPNKPPRSIAEMEAMNDVLTVVSIERNGKREKVRYKDLTPEEKEAKDFDLVQAGHLPSVPGWYNQMWGFWFGGRLWDGKQTLTPDSPENIAAYEWVQSYPERFGVDNIMAFGATFGNMASPQNPFLSGQVAMCIQGVWMQNFIEKYAPDLDWAAGAPFPSSDPERFPNVTLVECDTLVIPKGARHPREAFEFIRYVNTQEPMEKLTLGQKKFSPLAKLSGDYIARHPNPYIETFINLARSPNVRYCPRLSIWLEYRDELTVAANRVETMTATPAEALHEVKQRSQSKFDRVNKRWDKVKESRIQAWEATTQNK